MRKLKHAEVQQLGGMPTLLVDGVPYGPMTHQWSISRDEAGEITQKTRDQLVSFGQAGIKIYFLRINIDDPRKLDDFMDELKAHVDLLRECVPGAMAMIWFVIRAYEDFVVKYPDEVLTFQDGSTGGWNAPQSMGLTDPDTPRHSFASEVWKKEVGGMLREVVRRVGDSDLCDTIIGYFFFAHSYEWNYYGDYDHGERCLDYSPAMQKAFRRFLIEKYHGDTPLLREAWRDASVTFETAGLPTLEQKRTPDYGYFWDPAKSAQVLDYAECHSEVVSEKLEYFSKVCKEESDFHALVGSFWGYFQNQDTLWGGQARAKRLMDCPYLDFWAAPYTYENKKAGDFASMRYMVKSLQKHGKLYFAEADTFIHDSSANSHIHHGFPMNTYAQSESLLKRDFVYPLCEGTQAWWIDWSAGDSQFRENEFKPLMRRMQRIAADALRMPRHGASDIAALVDQESLLYVPKQPQKAGGNDSIFGRAKFMAAQSPEEIHRRFPFYLVHEAIDRFRIHELPRIGSPVEFFETDDLLEGSGHKLYIFLNQYAADRYERAKIAENLKKNGNVLVFMYGAGALYPDGRLTAGAENVSDLTGIRMGVQMREQRARMRTTAQAERVLPGLAQNMEIGDFDRPIDCGFAFRLNGDTPFLADPNRVNPVFFADDPEAVVLARYIEGGQAAFALKEHGDWTSVYIGSPAVQACVLRALAKRAGAHLYLDEDIIVYANQSFVGVHAKAGGKKRIHLRKKANVVEAFEERAVALDTIAFEDEIPETGTKLYCLRPEDLS